MNTSHMKQLSLASVLLALVACGGGGGGDAPAPPPPPAAPAVALARVEALVAGSACAQGGRVVALGLDSNANGQLDDSEVSARTELCNGQAGPRGAAALALTDTLAPGSDCAQGGLRVRAGLDSNGDGQLAATETASTTVVCNAGRAAAGRLQLVSLEPVSAGSACAGGGTRAASGLDLNGNGLLDSQEVTTTQLLCNASPGAGGAAAALPLLALSHEAPGATCPAGGERIATGRDGNGNGVLDSDEVSSSSVVCQGAAGAAGTAGPAGADSLLVLLPEAPGNRCPNGGTRLDAGADRNGNGVLDSSELTSTRYLCNVSVGAAGASGAAPLVAVQAEPAGPNCAAGGRRLDAGTDSNRNGQLDAVEVSSSGYVCDGATGSAGSDGQNGLVRVSTAGSACASGGQAVASGLDANRNGVLDDAEVASIELVCNAPAGAAGAAGAVGASGLVVTSALAPGVPCPTGGQSLRRGLDSNGNGALDSGEVQATTVACNGSDSGGFVWTASAGSSLSMGANQGYIITRADAEAVVALPALPTLGALYRVSGSGAGGWVLIQQAGQRVVLSGTESMVRRSGLFTNWQGFGPVQTWQALAASADLGVLVGGVRNGTLQVSRDGGATWVARASAAAWQAVAASADGQRLAAAAAGGQIHTSTDGGVTWTARDSVRNWAALASSSDGRRLVAAVNNGRLFTSSDAGLTWAARESTRAWRAVASSADGQRLLAAAFGGPLFTSNDGGVSWVARESSRSWTAVASSARGERLLAADYGGALYLSSDGGATWAAVGPPLGWTAVAMGADGGRLVATADNGSVVASDDGGANWSVRASTSASTALAMSADGADAVQGLLGGTLRASWGARGLLSTRGGTAGALRGGQGSSAELQYLGDGVFLLRSHEGALFVD